MKNCEECGKGFRGRTDKVYCSIKCKNRRHYRKREKLVDVTNDIDQILHRNYHILKKVLGDHKQKLKIPELRLSKEKFNYNYMTNFRTNTAGKVYHYVYDLAWMAFSDNEILIVKQKKMNL